MNDFNLLAEALNKLVEEHSFSDLIYDKYIPDKILDDLGYELEKLVNLHIDNTLIENNASDNFSNFHYLNNHYLMHVLNKDGSKRVEAIKHDPNSAWLMYNYMSRNNYKNLAYNLRDRKTSTLYIIDNTNNKKVSVSESEITFDEFSTYKDDVLFLNLNKSTSECIVQYSSIYPGCLDFCAIDRMSNEPKTLFPININDFYQNYISKYQTYIDANGNKQFKQNM